MAEHPFRAEIELWASDPKYWVWQFKTAAGRWVNRPLKEPPAADTTDAYRLVPRPWLKNPEKWEVVSTDKRDGSTMVFTEIYEWNHKLFTHELRPRRRMARIESAEFPAPETEAPPKGTKYWVADPCYETYVLESEWEGDSIDLTNLERGLVYLNEEDAAARSTAMLEMTLC